MKRNHGLGRCIGVVFLAAAWLPSAAQAAGCQSAFVIGVETEGFFLNPSIKKIMVTEAEPGCQPAREGIVRGDELLAVEGHEVPGARARELKGYLEMAPGETRTLVLRHASGATYTAHLTKPKE